MTCRREPIFWHGHCLVLLAVNVEGPRLWTRMHDVVHIGNCGDGQVCVCEGEHMHLMFVDVLRTLYLCNVCGLRLF